LQCPECPRTVTDYAGHSCVPSRVQHLHGACLPHANRHKPLPTRLLSVQVYAPVDDNPAAFHRTVSLFISPDGDKLAQAGTGVARQAGRQPLQYVATCASCFLSSHCCVAVCAGCPAPNRRCCSPPCNPCAVRALRCQLPRANKFYPPDPPKKTDVRPPQLPGQRRSAPACRGLLHC
jgi:hypothetical protein